MNEVRAAVQVVGSGFLDTARRVAGAIGNVLTPGFDTALPIVQQAGEEALKIASPAFFEASRKAQEALQSSGVDTQPVFTAAKTVADAAQQTTKVIEGAKPIASFEPNPAKPRQSSSCKIPNLTNLQRKEMKVKPVNLTEQSYADYSYVGQCLESGNSPRISSRIQIGQSSQIQLKALAEKMQAVHKGSERVEQERTASENDGSISSGFRKVLKSFLDFVEADVKSLTALYNSKHSTNNTLNPCS
ncbi:uncharacterized protein LOC127130985 [Lathyrus oleraceus]|uniref:uncharacterized protein LOC127130985 n=1 Tax=Pisum sativum TaxID=3888 RepID=UPI0021CF1618|nr:uncharacterized protein LOC127130985 [Pisum sativum]